MEHRGNLFRESLPRSFPSQAICQLLAWYGKRATRYFLFRFAYELLSYSSDFFSNLADSCRERRVQRHINCIVVKQISFKKRNAAGKEPQEERERERERERDRRGRGGRDTHEVRILTQLCNFHSHSWPHLNRDGTKRERLMEMRLQGDSRLARITMYGQILDQLASFRIRMHERTEISRSRGETHEKRIENVINSSCIYEHRRFNASILRRYLAFMRIFATSAKISTK